MATPADRQHATGASTRFPATFVLGSAAAAGAWLTVALVAGLGAAAGIGGAYLTLTAVAVGLGWRPFHQARMPLSAQGRLLLTLLFLALGLAQLEDAVDWVTGQNWPAIDVAVLLLYLSFVVVLLGALLKGRARSRRGADS